ncbi:hypothetical protein G6N74_04840 [Mesorhizobium sp. CGMCC 1.15528]|uniref:Uncharacterized protein n=1 Tax=Mesorhizobium zhangyense TaxID=1776730 RepID=A0A7C9R5C4_9HYPH|nr:hypothetical protein [Mesorhizobium zhangyense]NGN40382.1 hypothetical protein [Mesorhizobium zhangyense]
MESSQTDIVATLIGWTPILLIMLWLVYFTKRSQKRQGSMVEVARENTEAIRENTVAMRDLIAKLNQAKGG